jgi:ERCC4-type nuclease
MYNPDSTNEVRNTSVRLLIDTRESDLITLFKEQDVLHESVTLDIADIEIVDGSRRFLMERKTIKDLAASIVDGRFKDQKDRMLGILEREPTTAISYILEGNLRGGDTERISGRITVGMIRNLLYTIQYKYRIPVIQTTSVRDTAMYIRRFHQYLVEHPDFIPVGSGSNAGCASYKTLLPTPVSNRGTSHKDLSIAAMTVVAGVSHKTSEFIVNSLPESCQGSVFLATQQICKTDMETILGSIKISGKRIAEKTRMALINWMYPTPTTGQISETPTTGQLENIVG